MEKLSVTYEKIREDFITTLAREKFGIGYLYPWQHFVVACILDAFEFQTCGAGVPVGAGVPGGVGRPVGARVPGGVRGLVGAGSPAGAGGTAGAAGDDDSDSYCRGRQIVLLPTGAGKSLCFQLPALVFPGPTLVIYPLLALMTDQQRRMEEGFLGSVMFRGGMSEEEIEENFRRLGCPSSGGQNSENAEDHEAPENHENPASSERTVPPASSAKIIIANPEVLKNEALLQRLCGAGISHIAIDEAHCCSEWGDTFRPAYLELGKVIKKINPPVVTAFTATASPSVLKRISEILFDGNAHVVRSESDRKNILYYVRHAAAKKKEALLLAKTELHPMIIFCGTRAKSEDMAHELNVCFGAGAAKFYHAGLERSEKEAVEKWFYESKDGILCATCAYGMGVDKKDIKTVVHLEASATAEAYIQEAGRGGRDGSLAKAFLIWSPADSKKYGAFPSGSRESAMRDFAESESCRRQVLLDALGAEQAVCSGCDICSGDEHSHKSDWLYAREIVRHNRHFYTKTTLKQRLFSDFNAESRKIFGLNIWTHSDCEDVVSQLPEF